MPTISQVLDTIRDRRSLASDNALAGLLGVTRASVSNWRTGRNMPDAVQCARLADLAGLPLAQVIGAAGEARAISREEKAVWKRLASAAALFLLVAATPLQGARASASQFAVMPSVSIMFRRWAARWCGIPTLA